MFLLTLFAAMERDAINVLVEAYVREAQFWFLSIAGRIEPCQRAVDARSKTGDGARASTALPEISNAFNQLVQ